MASGRLFIEYLSAAYIASAFQGGQTVGSTGQSAGHPGNPVLWFSTSCTQH